MTILRNETRLMKMNSKARVTRKFELATHYGTEEPPRLAIRERIVVFDWWRREDISMFFFNTIYEL